VAARSSKLGLGLVGVAIVLALTSTASAQVEVTGNGSAVEPFRVDDLDPESPELDMPIRLFLPTWNDLPTRRGELLDSAALHAKIPGTLRLRYRGFHGFVLKHLTRRFRKEWSKSIRAEAASASSYDTVQVRRRLNVQRSNAIQDHKAGGRWWERRWFHSFAEEKGGVRKGAYTQTVGETLTILKIGPLTLNNQFRGRFDKVAAFELAEPGRIYRGVFDDEEPLQARSDAQLSRDNNPLVGDDLAEEADPSPTDSEGPARVIAPASSLDLWLDLETKDRSAFGLTYRLKVRPRVHTRVTTEKITVSMRLKAALEISMGVRESRRRVVDVEFAVRYKPDRNDLRAELEIVLVRW
jgi:hypothetical protein